MSRSYKKNDIVTGQSQGCSKWAKRKAAKRVRKSNGLVDGSKFKRFYESWIISDWRCKGDGTYKTKGK